MTGQLMLVIAGVGAGITASAAIALRLVKASRNRNASKTGAVGTATIADQAPARTDPAPTTADAMPTVASGRPANLELTTADAHRTSRPESVVAPRDDVELEFTLEIADPKGPPANGTAAATTPPPVKPTEAAPAPPLSEAPLAPSVRAPSPAASPPPPAAATPPPTTQSLHPAEIFAKLFDLALGKARPASTISTSHDEVVTATAAALHDAATQERYSPRRPNMLPKILSASNDDSFSRRELAALIARDPSLVGNLLKIANSSYYRVTPEPVESVDRAVVLLGTDGIRSLVTAALMQPIFRIGGADFPRFPEIAWEHTFRSANAAVPYNFLMEKSDPYAAELLSLVMGLAEIVVFRVTMDQYAKLPRLRPDAGIVSSILDAHSAAVARRIGASWELSEPTLAGLDGQSANTTQYPTALGRSLYFGRVVGALAVLRVNHVIDDNLGKASIPSTSMPEAQIERMWVRLTPKPEKH